MHHRALTAACIALALTAAAACSSQQRHGARQDLSRRGPFEELFAALEANGYQHYRDDLAAGSCGSVNCELYEYGGTILHEAAAASDTLLITLMIEHGADIDARDREGWTPLMLSADSCCPEAAELLLGHGAGIGIVNKEGRSALDIAKESECGDVETIINDR
jgi:ankyrin repeat protein